MKTTLLAVLGAALLLPALSRAEEPEAACDRVASAPIPAKDLPSAVEKKALQGCDSEALYYGIGTDADPAKARACAFAERDSDAGPMTGGSAILMMIYANGKGVPKDFDLALRFACEMDGAPAELEGRVEHLAKMKAGTDTGEIDFCDDVTSGMMEGVCAAHSERVASVERDERRSKIVAKLPKAEWSKLEAAAKAFFDSRSDAEVDQSGTGRAAFMIEERSKLEDGLNTALGLLAGKEPAPAKAEDFKTADVKLNALYASIMKKKDLEYGTVTRDGIKTTQRLWIPYRDAFVALAAKARPDVPGDAWRAWLTMQRIEMLSEFQED